MKYILTEKLKAEIEKRQEARQDIRDSASWKNEYWPESDFCTRDDEDDAILSIITSLQQEQPEVDLEKEISRFLSNATMMNKGEWKGKYPISKMGFGVVARHFFNLGLNARKEENK